LRLLAHEERLEDSLEIICEAPWREVKQILGKAWIGTNAMWNEHFGMGIVEYMAAGLIPAVHASGGPQLDIVRTDYGYLATDAAGFAKCYAQALDLPQEQCIEKRRLARESSRRFSSETFRDQFYECVNNLLTLESSRRSERIYRTRTEES